MKTAAGKSLIHNGQLLDGCGGAAVEKAAVLVEDGRIAYAGPSADCPETDAEKIDARGGTIMPG
ncbi:MAG: amidohydrolase family protein, partial [Verrucomicrobiota bacterium]|nr:amidohydrolase family protein [Verrucomicrobiota bacterium]